MATAGNYVQITGFATRDPELRHSNAGSAVCNFGVAHNRSWKNNKTDEWESEPCFLNVTAFAQLGENVAESVEKGQEITVTGYLRENRYTPEGEDKEVVKIVIVADDVAVSLKRATAKVTKNPKEGEKPSGGKSRKPAADYEDEPF